MEAGAKLISRDEALALLAVNVSNQNLIKHMLATEVVLGALAARLGEDVPTWRMAGLLHDIDYDQTGTEPTRHSKVGAEMLQSLGFAPEIVYAVLSHNHVHGVPRLSLLDKALYAADPVTGLVVAAALIHPDKKLRSIDLDFVMNRHKMASFAKGANREQIAMCSELGMEPREFIGIALEAMQNAHEELGL